jgi:hypothetical protein
VLTGWRDEKGETRFTPASKNDEVNLDELTRANLDDASRFAKVVDVTVDWVWSYADMTPGKTDREKREKYRQAAMKPGITRPATPALWWAFRITFEKSPRLLDADNVAKLIVDAFSGSKRIQADNSPLFEKTKLYDDDTVQFVRVVQVAGAPGPKDRSRVEVFACIAE